MTDRGGSRSSGRSARSTSSRSARRRADGGRRRRNRCRCSSTAARSLAGLTVAGRRPRLIICRWATPIELSTWRLDLAGFAVGYEGGGITVAGGLRKLDRNGERRLRRHAARPRSCRTALTAVGGYGVFPDGAGGEYTRSSCSAAVTAPIGGPPAFFVTGLGGGFGVNRRLIAPTTSTRSPPSRWSRRSTRSRDGRRTRWAPSRPARRHVPARAGRDLVRRRRELHQLRARRTRRRSSPSRSTTGSRSTSSGWPAWRCPTPRFAAGPGRAGAARPLLDAGGRAVGAGPAHRQLVAGQRELSGSPAASPSSSGSRRAGRPVRVHASAATTRPSTSRRSTRTCRGSASPGTPAPAWSIKGGGYFALTATCVMAGGALEVSYNSDRVGQARGRRPHAGLVGPVLLRLPGLRRDLGRHRHRGLLLRLRPGADELLVQRRGAHHGTEAARLGQARPRPHVGDHQVRADPGATNSANPLSFAAFRDKYLRSGDDGGHVLAAAITAGQVQATATTTGSGAGSGEQGKADDGTAGRPWKVAPSSPSSCRHAPPPTR